MFLTIVLWGVFIILSLILVTLISHGIPESKEEEEVKSVFIFYLSVFVSWVLLGIHLFDGGITNICK